MDKNLGKIDEKTANRCCRHFRAGAVSRGRNKCMGSTKGTSQLGRYPALLLVRKLGRSRKSMELTPEAIPTPKNHEQHYITSTGF
jgi:hypothetical protein